LYWFAHGEPYVTYETMIERMIGSTFSSSNAHGVVDDNNNPYRSMVIDAMRMNEGYANECSIVDEEINTDAPNFFDLLKESNESLWDGCTNHNKLSVVAHVFTIRSDHGLSEISYNIIVE